jgi:endonuclease/exonuclease/phosphatase family metal-dependent hydrolase
MKMKFNLMKNKKILYIALFIIIISTVSVITVYLIIRNIPRPPDPDNIPPEIHITHPAEGETLSGSSVITFTAADQQGIITERQILIDGTVVRTDSNSYTWDTTKETDGAHIVSCRAKDETTWGSDEINIFVDNSMEVDITPPNVSIISPIANSTVSGLVNIEMDATDASGISSYAISIDGYLVANQRSYSWDTTQEINGSHEIFCEARDPSNNIGNDTISVIVNNSQAIEIPPITFKIMEFNINSSGQYSDWETVVKEENADIILFVETGYWDNGNNAPLDQYVDEFNTYFSDEDPYFGYCSQDIWYWADGLAIMSRYPILSFDQIPEVTLDNGTSFDLAHDIIDAELNVSGTVMHLIGSHLKAFEEEGVQRELEQQGIINYIDSLGDVPIVYLGDMNSFSPEDWGLNTIQSGLGYGPLSMMVAPYINPETSIDYSNHASTIHTWTDVYRILNPTDWGITDPEYDSRIDFIYVNQFLTSNIVNSTTGDTLHSNSGSDHYTVDVFMELNY